MTDCIDGDGWEPSPYDLVQMGQILENPRALELGETLSVNENDIYSEMKEAYDQAVSGNWGNTGFLLGQAARKTMNGPFSAEQMDPRLTARDFGLDNDHYSFMVSDQYMWSEKEYTLPVDISFDFTFAKDGELIPAFSANKEEWGQSPDALSWYASTLRHDFTFRTEMFGGFPYSEQVDTYDMHIGRKYHMEAYISENFA